MSLPPVETITITGLTIAVYMTGAVCAISALWRSRTPQGAAAWVVALLTIPILTVPFFLLLGRNKFYGYVRKRSTLDSIAQKELAEAQQVEAFVEKPADQFCELHALAPLCRQPGYTRGNQLDLLVDGEPTFDALMKEIKAATKYILFQFYIIRDDKIGNRFAELLREKARQGVKVYFLYDSLGTNLGSSFIKKLEACGIQTAAFRGMRRWTSRAQVNFRNHRKIVVIDGHVAFTGGLNVGDDYLGQYPELGPWRDTHVRVAGPAALNAQLAFAKDWFWAQEKVPDLDWQPRVVENGSAALFLATGPADDGEPSLLAHIALINTARQRVWIANPYFIPPEPLMRALQLAVLRGVDVRILLPSYSDNKMIVYASAVYQEQALEQKIRLIEYLPGFLHQKVMLIDDAAALIGSVNFDSRSFFINFEAMVVGHHPQLIQDVEKMLMMDFSRGRELRLQDYRNRPLWKKIRSRIFSLLSPML
jgi:cardiolipin synthase